MNSPRMINAGIKLIENDKKLKKRVSKSLESNEAECRTTRFQAIKTPFKEVRNADNIQQEVGNR